MDNNWSAEDNWLGTPAQHVELLMCEPHTYMPKKDLPGKLQAVAATLERREEEKEKHVHSRQWVTCELLVRYW